MMDGRGARVIEPGLSVVEEIRVGMEEVGVGIGVVTLLPGARGVCACVACVNVVTFIIAGVWRGRIIIVVVCIVGIDEIAAPAENRSVLL
jgi:hypothetical protein